MTVDHLIGLQTQANSRGFLRIGCQACVKTQKQFVRKTFFYDGSFSSLVKKSSNNFEIFVTSDFFMFETFINTQGWTNRTCFN